MNLMEQIGIEEIQQKDDKPPLKLTSEEIDQIPPEKISTKEIESVSKSVSKPRPPRTDGEMRGSKSTPQVAPQVTPQVTRPATQKMSEDEFNKVSQLPETDPRFIALQKAMKKSVDTGDTDESDYDNWLAKKRKLNFDYERAKKVEQQRDTETLKSLQDAEAGDAETQVLAEKLKKKRSRILNNLLSESTLDNAKSGIKEVPDNKDPYDEVGLQAVSDAKSNNESIQGYLNKFPVGDDGNVVTGWRKAPKTNADAIVEPIFGEDTNPLSNIKPVLDEKGNIKDFGGELVLDLTDTKDLSGKAFGTAVLGKVLPNLTADEDVQKAVQEAIDPNSKFGSLDEAGKYIKPYYDIVDAYQTNPSNYATHNGKIYGSYNVSSSLVNWVLSAKALKEEGKLTPEALREAMPKVEKIISDYNEQSDQFLKRQEMVNEGKTDYTLSDSLSSIFNQFRAFGDFFDENRGNGKLQTDLENALGITHTERDKVIDDVVIEKGKANNQSIVEMVRQANIYQSTKESSILQKNAEKFGSNMIWNAITTYSPVGIARFAGKGQQAITSVLQPQEDSSNVMTRFFENIDKNHSFKDEIALQQIAPIVPTVILPQPLSELWLLGSTHILSRNQPRSEYIANMGLILGTLGLGKVFGLGRDYASSQAGKVASSVLNTGTTLAGATGNIYINDKMFKNEDGSWNVGKLFLGTGLDVVNLGTKELPHSLSLLFKGREPKTAYSFGVVDADTGQRHLFFEDPNSGFLTLQKVNEKLYNEVMEYNTKEGRPSFQQTVPSEAIKAIQLATNGKKNAFKKAFFGKDSETAEIVKSTPADYLEIDGNRVKVFNLEKALSENSVPKADVPDYEERADGVLTALQEDTENIKSMGGDKDFIRTIRQMREEDLISIKPNGDIQATAEGISRLEKNNTLRAEFKNNFEAELGKTASEVEGMTSDEVRNQPNEKETFAQKAIKEINYKKYFDNEGEPIKITALDYQKMGDGEKKIVREAVVLGKLEQDKDGNIVNTSFKESYKNNSVMDFGRSKKSFAERELFRLGRELDSGNRKNITTIADKLDLTNKEASSQAKKAFEFYSNQAKEYTKNVDSSIGEEYSIPMTLRGKEEPVQETPSEIPAPPKFPARVKTYGNTDFTKQAVGALDFNRYTLSDSSLPNRFVTRDASGKVKVYSRISDTTFSRDGSSTVHISEPVLKKMLHDEKLEIATGLSNDAQNQLGSLAMKGNENFSLIARHSKLGQDRYSPLNLDEKTQVVNDDNWNSGKDVVLEQHPDGEIKVNPRDERWNSNNPYFLANENSVNVYVNKPMMGLVKKILDGDKAHSNPAENFDVRKTQFLKDLTKNPDTSVFSANDIATAKSFSEFIKDRDQVNLVTVDPLMSYQTMRYKSIHEPTHQITNELGQGYAVKAIPTEMSNSLAQLPEGQKFLEGVQKSTYAFTDENGQVKKVEDLSDTEKQISFHEIFTHATDQSYINNIGIKSAEDLDTFAKNYVNLFTALEKHHGTSVDNVLRFIDRNLLEVINNENERRNSFERLTDFENGGRGRTSQESQTPNTKLAYGVGFTEGNGQKDFRGLRVTKIRSNRDFKFLIGKEDGTDPSPHKIDAQFNLADISTSPEYKGLFKNKSLDTLRTILKMDGYDGYFSSSLDTPDHQRYEVTLFDTEQNKSKLGGIELAVKAPVSKEGFYSPLEDAWKLESEKEKSKIPEKSTGEQYLNIIKGLKDSNGKGITKDEMDWSGISMLEPNKKYTKQEISDLIREQKVVVNETRLSENEGFDELRTKRNEIQDDIIDELMKPDGGDKSLIQSLTDERERISDQINNYELDEFPRYSTGFFGQLNLGGKAKGIVELLFSIPNLEKGNTSGDVMPQGWSVKMTPTGYEVTNHEGNTVLAGMTSRKEAIDTARYLASTTGYPTPKIGAEYLEGHFSSYETNIFAHLRGNERQIEGKRAFHIEEVQSDLHQAGYNEGYQPEVQKQRTELNKRIQETLDESIKLKKDLKEKYPDIPWRDYNHTEYDTLMFDIQNGDVKVGLADKDEVIQDIQDVRSKVGELSAERYQLARKLDNMGEGIPDAPFRTTWHELTFKRALRYAVEKGMDMVTWTTGKQQIERYEDTIRQNVDSIKFKKIKEEDIQAEKDIHIKRVEELTQELESLRARNREIESKYYGNEDEYEANTFRIISIKSKLYDLNKKIQEEVIPKIWIYVEGKKGTSSYQFPIEGKALIEGKQRSLEDVVGRDIAKQIREGGDFGEITGDNLSIGGQFHKFQYDQKIPKFVEKFVKPWNGKVEQTLLDTGKETSVFTPIDDKIFDTEEEANQHAFSLMKDPYELFSLGKDGKWYVSKLEWTPDPETVWKVDITPEMRTSVMDGLPLFAKVNEGLYKQQEAFEGRKEELESVKNSNLVKDAYRTSPSDLSTEKVNTILNKGFFSIITPSSEGVSKKDVKVSLESIKKDLDLMGYSYVEAERNGDKGFMVYYPDQQTSRIIQHIGEKNNDSVIHGLGGKYYEEAQGYRYPVSLESKSVFDDKTSSLQKDYAEQNGIQLNVDRDNLKLPTESFFKKLSTEHNESVHNPEDAEVKKSYKSFISETKNQYDFLKKSGIKIEAFNGDGEPYKNSSEMIKDISNGHYYYLKSDKNINKNHPLWENSGTTDSNNRKLSNNDMFRIVHDLMGHSGNKWQFGIRGEFNAFATHSELYSKESLPALISETLMQNSVVADKNYVREGDSYKLKTSNIEFAEQKAIIPNKKTVDFVMKEIESQKSSNKDAVSVKTSDGGNRLNFNTNWDAPQKVETNLDNARLKLESRQNIKGNIVSNNDIRNAYRDGIFEDAQGNKLDENTVFDRTGKKVGSVRYDEQGNAYVHFDNEKKNSETRVNLIDGVGKKGRDRFYVDKAGRDIIGALGTYQELVKMFNPQVAELKKPEQGASPQEIEAYNIKKNEIWLSSIDKHLQQWNDSPVKMWYDGVEDFAKKVGRDVKDVNNDIGKLWLFLHTAITSPNTTIPENTKYAMDVMATMVNAFEEGNFNIPRFQHDQDGHLIVSDFEKPKQYGLGSVQLEKTKLLSQGYVPANSIEGKAIVNNGGVVKRASELIPNSVKGNNLFVESPLAKQMMEKYGALQGVLNYLMSPALEGKPNKALDFYGDKLGAFFSNLVGLTQIPTIDTWMNRHFKALTGDALQVERNGNGTITKIKDNTKNFNTKDGDEIRAVIQKATEDWNKKTGQKLTPADTQAIIWSSIKDTFNDFVAKTQKNVDFSEAYDQIRQRYEAVGKQPLQAPDERLDQPIVAPQVKELLDSDLKREMGDRWYLESKDGLELAVRNIPDVDLQNQKIDWSDPLLKACDKDSWVDIGTRLVSNNILANDEVRRIEHLADKGDFNGLQKYVLGLNKMGVLELFLNLTRIGLTFGIKNFAKNIAGNGTRAFLDSVENVPLPVLDFGMRLINKHILRGDNNEKGSVSVLSNPISTAKIYGTSFAKVITEGLPEAWQTLKGENKDLVFEHPSLTRERTTGIGLLKPFEAFERFGWRFLGSQDKPWNVFAYHKAIGDFKTIRMEEQRQAGNNISWSDAEHYLTISDYQLAEISALDASYQGDNKLAGWYYGQVQKLPQFWRGIVTNIPKFVKTPLNVVDYMLDHTLIYPLAKLSYDKYNSKDFVDWKGTVKELFNNPQDRKLLSLMITKGAIGSAMLFAGFKMGQAGILNPFYQEKEKSEREQMQAKGTSYGSVEIGGKSLDISVFSPVSFYMLAGASMAKSSQEYDMSVERYKKALEDAQKSGEADKIEKAQRVLNEAQKKSPTSITASQIFKNWAEQTPFARQVSDVFDAQGKGNVFGVLEQWYDPTQLVPAIVKEVAEFRDPKKRVIDDSNYWTRTRDKFKSQIPSQRETLPVAYDMLGREISQPMPYDVTRSKVISDEKLVNELDRFNISIPFNEKGSSVEKNQMKGEKGRYFEPILQDLINSNEYNKSSESIKQEMMRDTMYAVNREYSDKKLKPEEFANNLRMIKSRNYYVGQLTENPDQFARKRQITDKDIVRDFIKAGVDTNIDIKGVLNNIPNLDDFLKEKFTHNFMIGKNLSLAEAQKNFKEFEADPEKEIIRWWISEKEYQERSNRLREKKEELIKQGKTDEEIRKALAKDSAKLGWERRKGKYGTVKSVNTADTPKKFLDTGVTGGRPDAEDKFMEAYAGVDLPSTTALDGKDVVLKDNLESTLHNAKVDDLEKHLNKKFTSEEKTKIFNILSARQSSLAGAIKIYETKFNQGQLNSDDIDWLQKTKAEKKKIDKLVDRFANHPFADVRESQNIEDIR